METSWTHNVIPQTIHQATMCVMAGWESQLVWNPIQNGLCYIRPGNHHKYINWTRKEGKQQNMVQWPSDIMVNLFNISHIGDPHPTQKDNLRSIASVFKPLMQFTPCYLTTFWQGSLLSWKIGFEKPLNLDLGWKNVSVNPCMLLYSACET